MSQEEIGPTALGKFVAFLFIVGCLGAASLSFFPELKAKVWPGSKPVVPTPLNPNSTGTGGADGQGTGGTAGGADPALTGQTGPVPAGPTTPPTATANPAAAEAPDGKTVTTVAEYKYVPQERLPPVKGVSGYVWDPNTKVVEFPVNVWVGWLPIVAANRGFGPNEESIFFKKFGFKVNLKLIDDPVAARDAYVSGKSHILWGTVDMMALFAGELLKDSRTAPRIFQQIDWSSGGDGIVVRNAIASVRDLAGKTVVYAQNSPSQYFFNNLLINAGVQPGKVKHKYTATAFEAAAAFVADRSIDACVSWAPDIYNIPNKVPGTRILTTTADANKLIADVWAVRADFAKDHPEVIKGLVEGIFEGMTLIKSPTEKAKAFQWLAEGYGMKVEDVKGMENDAHLTNFAENLEFFVNANNPTNFERTWKNVNFVYRELGLIGTPVRFDEVMDFSVLKELQTEGKFKDHKNEYVSRYASTSFSKVSAEAPILTQTIRINFYPNSANVYEPEHDEFGQPMPNTLYDPTVDATLEKVGRMIGQFDRAIVAVTGHTDGSNKGKIPERIVKDLSRDRAMAVRDSLVKKYRFDPTRFTVEGMGWTTPADPAEPNNNALNRRVEISIYTPEQ